MIHVLKVINDGLKAIGVNYEFAEWTTGVVYPYFVGEYEENERAIESGESESTFMLTGTTRGTWYDLEQKKALIETKFNGLAVVAEDGTGIFISYGGSFPVPTGEQDLKRIQINLKIKEWKVI